MQTKQTFRSLAVVVLLLLPVLSVFAVGPYRIAGQTNADRLRVRTEPNLAAESVGNLAVGTGLEILDVTAEEMVIGEMSARWYRIQTLPGEDPLEGWSYGYFIDVDQDDLLAKAIWLDMRALVTELIETGADVDAALIEEGTVFTQYDEYSYSSRPLMEAVRAGREEIVEKLLASGADPDAEFIHGEPGGTERSNSLTRAVEIENPWIVTLLVQNGADLDAVKTGAGGGGDRFQVTPLVAAIERGDRYLVEYLLTEGADVNHVVKFSSLLGGEVWKSPLDLAVESDLTEITAVIRSFGGESADTP